VATVSEHELDKAYKENFEKYGGLKEDYFALIYLCKEFRLTTDEAASSVAFGNNDYGIDAFHIDTDRKALYLYQFKWSDNHHLFEETYRRLRSNGVERIFGKPKQDQEKNQVLIQLKHELNENKFLIKQIVFRFVFNGDEEKATGSKILASLQEDIEKIRYLIDDFFGKENHVDLAFSYYSNRNARKADIRPVMTHRFPIKLDDIVASETPSGEKLHVCLIRLVDLYNMHKQMHDRLFERNIRFGLNEDLPANKKIRAALKSIVLEEKDHPNVFVFNHNGITLTAQSLDRKGDNCIEIIEPRILNGAQTITSLGYFIEEENKNNPLIQKNWHILESIKVIAKIITDVTNPEFITKVTICNNQQTPVQPWNLRANDEIQNQLQDFFREKANGMFYERQEESFSSYNDDDLEEEGYNSEHGKAIKIKVLAKTFLSVQGESDKMSRLGDVFESDRDYKKTFSDIYLNADIRKIILAYKVQMALSKTITNITDKWPKYSYLKNARNLVSALLVQGILNNEELDSLCEQYGTDLVIQGNFRAFLTDLLSRRIRPIIADATEKNKQYYDLIEKERYTFFRTKEFYKVCMEIASRKYGWRKLTF
jgi:hypothetical protein